MIKVDGLKLLEMMKFGEIEYGTKIYVVSRGKEFDENASMKFYSIYGEYIQLHLYRKEKWKKAVEIRKIDTNDLLTHDFYIMQDYELEELVCNPYEGVVTTFEKIEEKINQIIKYLKKETEI